MNSRCQLGAKPPVSNRMGNNRFRRVDKRNRLIQLPFDAAVYALRNMVERCFNKLKNARRLATRYDKTSDNYLAFIHIVSIRLWTRQFVNAS